MIARMPSKPFKFPLTQANSKKKTFIIGMIAGSPAQTSVHHNNFDPADPLACIENNPSVPRNCTITRPPPITR